MRRLIDYEDRALCSLPRCQLILLDVSAYLIVSVELLDTYCWRRVEVVDTLAIGFEEPKHGMYEGQKRFPRGEGRTSEAHRIEREIFQYF
jgi:hypothetical protein